MTATEAPVNAQTSRTLNTIQNNLGGVANPNALYSDIALSGQQNAGLAGDNMLSQALNSLQSLFSMGYGGVNTGSSGLNNAAGGEAQLGAVMNNQQNAWWQSILGAAGEYYGLNHGQNTTQNNPNFNTNAPVYGPPGTYSPTTSNDTPFNFGGPNQGSFYGAPAVAPNTSSSAPISGLNTSGGSSYVLPPYNTGG